MKRSLTYEHGYSAGRHRCPDRAHPRAASLPGESATLASLAPSRLVLYVQHNERGGMEPGMPMWQIHPAVTPREGEPVIQKESPDSFHETRLQEELEARGIKRLVITGGQTQYCVDTTVRRAAAQGYDVLLASDAHTTEDSETLPAEQIIAFYNETLNGFRAGEHKV